MTRGTFTVAFFLAGMLLIPDAGLGQTPQFTFIVPVRLTNLHENVQTAEIRCNLYKGTDTIPAFHLNSPINLSRECPTCPPGDFSGNVTVEGGLPDGSTIKPEEIARYDCNLLLNDGFPRQTTDSRTAIELQAQVGTLFTAMVVGTIP